MASIALGTPDPVACIRFAHGQADWVSPLKKASDVNRSQATFDLLLAVESVGQQEYESRWQEIHEQQDDPKLALNALYVAFVEGASQEEIKRAAQETLQSLDDTNYQTSQMKRIVKTSLRYLAEGKSDDWLLSQTKNERNALVEANFLIAMKRFSERDFPKTKEHLSAAENVFAPWVNEYHWSRAILGWLVRQRTE
ncbi:hypothetical protein [Novipirellula artificiosorum]|uniref:Uncharacterized protein n=1 Tax=Novipirellula artificiosorum TaxID=2528016 RepID=A0A5C6DRJ6_9BACT|nr:hypothetical protein [Novipirellula artificiosorum]TWU38231.1 hypothetical protein Poly41_27070 [Novipirellula artificiosorum]